jgi:predicted RNA-binding protein YlqC (UPF0109 family)
VSTGDLDDVSTGDLDDVGEVDEVDDIEDADDGFDSEGIDEDELHEDANLLPAGTARAVLDFLTRSMVDDPDSVTIDVEERHSRHGGLTLAVRVAPGDMGRVIGKRGRIANAIRTVVRAAAVRDGVNVDVDFVE